MQKRLILKRTIAVSLSVTFYFVMRFIVHWSASSSLAMLVGTKTMENPFFVQGFLLLLSSAFCVNVYQLLTNRFSIRFIKVETVVYSILFFAIIMLKSRGVQEFNLDISDLYRSLIEYPVSVFANLLLFIPVGVLIFKYCKSMSKAFGLALAFIVAIETLQYLLHLGIFDIVDIVVDMFGFSIGFLTLSILKDAGYRIVREGKDQAKIARPQKHERYGSEDVEIRAVAHKRKIILVATFSGVFIMTLIVGFLFYDYEAYVPVEPIYTTTDKTLNNLALKSYDSADVGRMIDSMARFKVDGFESSNDWIKVNEAGNIKVLGAISNYETWVTEDNIQYYGLSLGIREQLGGITVTHGIPIIVMSGTELFLSGEVISFTYFTTNILPRYFQYEFDAECSLQDDWFRAESLAIRPYEDNPEVPYVYFDYKRLTQSTDEARRPDNGYLFEIYSNKSSSIEGYVDVLHENPDSDDYFTLRINSILGSNLICHTIDIKFDGKAPGSFFEKLSANNSSMGFRVYVKDGHILYAE